MLNKHPLALGQVYFSQPEMIQQSLESPEPPYVIDYEAPKILPFMSGWDNLLLPKKPLAPTLKMLIEQHLKRSRSLLGTELPPVDQFWIQLIRGLASCQQLVVVKHFLDELPPTDARQLLNDVRAVAAQFQIIVIMTTTQESVFNSFQSQVVS
ncbi:hypothetical protein [Latilactobacillus curvatus]|uniref:hypothetical protein n=1 Tax=Latilactobacillus curvatus TaxID=28038 RepID=UPI0009764D17|nr:hypothetical protein [Latilactobacillus curvatus]